MGLLNGTLFFSPSLRVWSEHCCPSARWSSYHRELPSEALQDVNSQRKIHLRIYWKRMKLFRNQVILYLFFFFFNWKLLEDSSWAFSLLLFLKTVLIFQQTVWMNLSKGPRQVSFWLQQPPLTPFLPAKLCKNDFWIFLQLAEICNKFHCLFHNATLVLKSFNSLLNLGLFHIMYRDGGGGEGRVIYIIQYYIFEITINCTTTTHSSVMGWILQDDWNKRYEMNNMK